ncbi:MAG: ThuA domain-containing protein [Tepidisphaerales bacterium]
MTIRSLLVAIVLGGFAWGSWGAQPQQAPNTDAQPAIAAAAPKGRVIIDGAYHAIAGSPATYAITYAADAAVAGKALRVSLKDSNPVDKMVKNDRTGVDEKKRVSEPVVTFVNVTLEAAGVETINLPEPKAKDSTLELSIVEAPKQFDAAAALAVYKTLGPEEKSEFRNRLTPEQKGQLYKAEQDDKQNTPGAGPVVLSNTLLLKPSAGTWALPEAGDLQKIVDALPAKATVPPARPRKVLCFTAAAGFYHTSIPFCARAIQLMGNKTGAWQAVISNDKFMFELETLAQFDAVMMCSTTGSLFGDKSANDRLRKSFLDFVASGKGLAGSHAATDCSYDWKEYGDMIGGFFQGHPFGKHFTKIDDPASPINAAFKGQGFDFSDEMYTFRTPYSREKLHILMSIDMAKTKLDDDPARPGFKKGENRDDHDYAISWIREYEKGRVFYCSYGHNHQIFWTPPVLQHFLDGLQYALGDLKADATPSAKK